MTHRAMTPGLADGMLLLSQLFVVTVSGGRK